MAIKLDMENDFDRVNHFFLFEIMLKMGFSNFFFHMDQSMRKQPMDRAFVNGRPASFFQASRGLYQGCPLFPLLYLIVAESLSKKLQALQNNRELRGLKIARGEKKLIMLSMHMTLYF